MSAFILQCNEAKNWYDGINKARHIFLKLKQEVEGQSVKVIPQQQGLVNNYSVIDSISIKKSPLGSSIGNIMLLIMFAAILSEISSLSLYEFKKSLT